MQVIHTIKEWKKLDKPLVIALGMFDGVHSGHGYVIDRAKKMARDIDGHVFVVTFDMHPRMLLYPNDSVKLLTTNDEKIRLLREMDVHGVLFLYFGEHLANMSKDVFVKDELVGKLGVRGIVVGENFRFGKDKEGDAIYLKKICDTYNLQVEIVNSQKYEDKVISSSVIRELIIKGDMYSVKKYLGREYFITGNIVHGKKLGSRHDVPTINIHLPKFKLVPKGVFAGFVEIQNKRYKALINVGTCPTVDDKNDKFVVEAHILDFGSDVYGETATIFFVEKIRDEKKFDSLDELFNQIEKDIEIGRRLLGNKK